MTELITANKVNDSPSVLPNEQDFFQGKGSGYAIYQLKPGQENHSLRFAGLSELHEPVRKERYDLVYIGSLPETETRDAMAVLEGLYAEFNLFPPEDFHGHSLSVSDVVILKQQDQFRAYYTDSLGFKPLEDFLPDLNPLRSAEMAMEDDYDMIDGIINNGSRKEKELLSDLKPDALNPRQALLLPDPDR